MEKPFSPSCERNREPILAALREPFSDRQWVLEIGSGTGQHAVHFAAAMPHLRWQCSDRAEALPGMRLWLDEAALPNTPPPLVLDVDGDDGSNDNGNSNGVWPRDHFDGVFSANTLHIMSWPEVERLFAQLPSVLAPQAVLAIYGPFNYAGRFSSESNATFDAWLKQSAAHRGIRDFEAVNALAESIGFQHLYDHAMPANNRLLVWRRN